MVTVRSSRAGGPGLLSRPPSGVGDMGQLGGSQVIDPVAQLSELVDLVERGLLSREEFEGFKQRFFAAEPISQPAAAPSPRPRRGT